MGTPASAGSRTSPQRLQATCLAAGLTVATAESCTGGLVAHAITSQSGLVRLLPRRGGQLLERGQVACSASRPDVLATHGAVSAQVAARDGGRRPRAARGRTSASGSPGSPDPTAARPTSRSGSSTWRSSDADRGRCPALPCGPATGPRTSRTSAAAALDALLERARRRAPSRGRRDRDAHLRGDRARPRAPRAGASRSRPGRGSTCSASAAPRRRVPPSTPPPSAPCVTALRRGRPGPADRAPSLAAGIPIDWRNDAAHVRDAAGDGRRRPARGHQGDHLGPSGPPGAGRGPRRRASSPRASSRSSPTRPRPAADGSSA